MEPTDFVCRLNVADIPRRANQLDILVPQVLARVQEGRTLTIDVASEAKEAVHGFVAEESKCCPFFSFRIEGIPNGVRLTVETPPGGEAMLGALEAAFQPGGASVRAMLEPLGSSLGSRRGRE